MKLHHATPLLKFYFTITRVVGLFVGKVSEGDKIEWRSISAQNMPLSVIPRYSVTMGHVPPPSPGKYHPGYYNFKRVAT